MLKLTELPQHTRLLKVSWFTDSIKAREPVSVQDKHVIAQGGDAVSLIILNYKSKILKSARVACPNFTQILILAFNKESTILSANCSFPDSFSEILSVFILVFIMWDMHLNFHQYKHIWCRCWLSLSTCIVIYLLIIQKCIAMK